MSKELERNLIQRVALGDIMRRTARRKPDKEALVEYRNNERISLTYQKANAITNQFVRALRELGLKSGDHVAAICLNSYEFPLSYYGLAKGGFVFVPVNPGLNPSDIDYIINHSGAKALIIDDVFISAFNDYLKNLPENFPVIALPISGAAIEPPVLNFDEIIKDKDDSEIEDVIINDRDMLQIMYTSGTTAKPKGVEISHLSVYIASLYNCIDLDVLTERVVLAILPMFHCAMHSIVNSTFHNAATLVVMRNFTPSAFLETVEKEKISWTCALPMMYRGVLEHPEIDNYDLSSLRTCLYVMTPIDRGTLEKAREKFGAGFVLATGQTEAYPGSNYFNPEWKGTEEGNYWGVSVLGFDTAVMDDEGNLLPPNQVGEIVWRSPAVMTGYYRDEESTKESSKYGWHHSGDLGYIDEEGLLVFVDRKKDMIKTGGENVPSIKVETVVMSHPDVAEAGVVGLPHEKWVEAITAFVVPKENAKAGENEIIDWCKKELGSFEAPKRVIFVDELPRTTTGKVKKHMLRHTYGDAYKD